MLYRGIKRCSFRQLHYPFDLFLVTDITMSHLIIVVQPGTCITPTQSSTVATLVVAGELLPIVEAGEHCSTTSFASTFYVGVEQIVWGSVHEPEWGTVFELV